MRLGGSPGRRPTAPRGRAPRPSASASGTSPGSRSSPSGSPSPATNGSSASRSAGSSPSVAGSSTSSRRPAASRCASSSSATRSRAIRAFSPFTQRALRPVQTRRLPGRRATARPGRADAADDERAAAAVPDDLVPPSPASPDLVWEPDEVERIWAEELDRGDPSFAGATELDPLPAGQPFAFEAQRPAIAARGLAEAENELAGFVRGGNRVVVAFPHRGEALRTQNMLRRVDARLLDADDDFPDDPELLFAVSPARRGFVWRELGLVLLPDTQVFRKRPPRARRASRPRPPVVRRPAHRRLRRPRGPRRREAARLRDPARSRRSRATTSCSRSGRRPAVRAARADRQGLALHRRRRACRPRSPSSAARPGS